MATKIKTIEMSLSNFEGIITSWLYAIRAIPECKDITVSDVVYNIEADKVIIHYHTYKPQQLELPLEG
jgi:hypothetical protein